MKQASTMKARRKQGKTSRPARTATQQVQTAAQAQANDAPWDLTSGQWKIACAAVLLVAALLRMLFLTMKPMHHDEGVNAFFMTSLFREGHYRYDPANYHGPTLYYLAL